MQPYRGYRFTHGATADLDNHFGTDIGGIFKCRAIGNLYYFWIRSRDGRNVHGNGECISVYTVPDKLLRQIILQFLPDERTGSPAEFVAYLCL